MTLNFLNAEQRTTLDRERRFLQLRSGAFVLCLIAILFSAVAWTNVVLLQQHADELSASIEEQRQSQESTETKHLESQIKLFNTQVKTVLEFEQDRFPVSQRLVAVFRAIPSGVSLEQIEGSFSGKTLTLRGEAKDRTAYLALKDAMNGTGFFTNLELPITDLLSREAIRFTLTTNLGPSFLEPLPIP